MDIIYVHLHPRRVSLLLHPEIFADIEIHLTLIGKVRLFFFFQGHHLLPRQIKAHLMAILCLCTVFFFFISGNILLHPSLDSQESPDILSRRIQHWDVYIYVFRCFQIRRIQHQDAGNLRLILRHSCSRHLHHSFSLSIFQDNITSRLY